MMKFTGTLNFLRRGCDLNVSGCLTGTRYKRHYSMEHLLHHYKPPQWAEHLPNIPNWRIKLGHLNTPIQKWNLPGVPGQFTLSIKRDDMTGSAESGNKVRKLEFLFGDAVSQGCSHVITSGSITSNHCRAVAVCARQLGIQPHVVLKTDIQDPGMVGCEGNLLLDRLCGAHIYLAPKKGNYFNGLRQQQNRIMECIQEKTGQKCYYIPVGGSNLVGLWGYMEAYSEMITQGLHENFDDIVFACGSGGTAGGLSIANHLAGNKLGVHAIAICDDAAYFHKHNNETLAELGIDVRSEDILDVIEGHKGKGYGISTPEELDFVTSVSASTGIFFDPVYTGKALKGLVHELNNNPHKFKGSRILYVHTGGIFGLYDGRMDPILKRAGQVSNSVHILADTCDDPPI